MTKFFLNLVCIFLTQQKLPKGLNVRGEREFIKGHPCLDIGFNSSNDLDFQSAISERNQQLQELFSRRTGLILCFYFSLALLMIVSLICSLNLVIKELNFENLLLLIYGWFAWGFLLFWQYPYLQDFVAEAIDSFCLMQLVYISFLLSNTNEVNLTENKDGIKLRIASLAKLNQKKSIGYRYASWKTKKYVQDVSGEIINLNLKLSSSQNLKNIQEKFSRISKMYVLGLYGEILPILKSN